MENIFDYDVLDTDNIKHKVSIYWVSPFKTLEKRVGYFEERMEAACYADFLKGIYTDFDFPFVIYIGSNIECFNKDIEFYSFVKAYREAKENIIK